VTSRPRIITRHIDLSSTKLGVEPQSLRDNHVLRQTVASELGEIQNALDSLMIDRPRRNILRRSPVQREAA
jgi:hypothetical protein